MPTHGARAGAVSGKRSVRDREDAGVYFLLDIQQIHQRFVYYRMRPVAFVVQQAAESVLHRAGYGRENVSLDRRQMQDVLSKESLWNLESVRVDLIKD